jgi:hypothetical protein
MNERKRSKNETEERRQSEKRQKPIAIERRPG